MSQRSRELMKQIYINDTPSVELETRLSLKPRQQVKRELHFSLITVVVEFSSLFILNKALTVIFTLKQEYNLKGSL